MISKRLIKLAVIGSLLTVGGDWVDAQPPVVLAPGIRVVPLPVPLPPPLPVPLPLPAPVIRPIHQADPAWFIPPHLGGDADFKGHGPYIKLRVSLYIKQQAPNEVWAKIEMDAIETKNDWTHAGNWGAPRHERVAVFARPVTHIESPWNMGVLNDRERVFEYLDTTDKGVDRFNNPCECGMLNSVTFVGDQVGREAGTRTGVKLEFNPILAR